jgi:MerR family transcriptional regulator, redox-sensitive transcriptional activator SoxR
LDTSSTEGRPTRMSYLAISELARRVGLRPSAVRYYERIGILPPAQRVSGKRRYDESEVSRLAVVQFARQTGFTLNEVRQLLHGFRIETPAWKRWKKLSAGKVRELQQQIDETQATQAVLLRLQQRCQCVRLEQCGKAWLAKACGSNGKKEHSKMPRMRKTARAH